MTHRHPLDPPIRRRPDGSIDVAHYTCLGRQAREAQVRATARAAIPSRADRCRGAGGSPLWSPGGCGERVGPRGASSSPRPDGRCDPRRDPPYPSGAVMFASRKAVLGRRALEGGDDGMSPGPTASVRPGRVPAPAGRRMGGARSRPVVRSARMEVRGGSRLRAAARPRGTPRRSVRPWPRARRRRTPHRRGSRSPDGAPPAAGPSRRRPRRGRVRPRMRRGRPAARRRSAGPGGALRGHPPRRRGRSARSRWGSATSRARAGSVRAPASPRPRPRRKLRC